MRGAYYYPTLLYYSSHLRPSSCLGHADLCGYFQAIWSINESDDRISLAIVTVVVAAVTYSITLNLNNIGRALRKVYGPKRRLLVDQMGQDPQWVMVGQRFKAFERADTGQKKPSEWMIVAFYIRQLVMAVPSLFRRSRKRKGVTDSESAG